VAFYFSFSEAYTKFLFIIATLGLLEFVLENYLGMSAWARKKNRKKLDIYHSW
jgi:hypothetical protein